jgi:hypothetical protein
MSEHQCRDRQGEEGERQYADRAQASVPASTFFRFQHINVCVSCDTIVVAGDDVGT